MHSFFNRIRRNAVNDTVRAFSGTAVSITLGVSVDFLYNKMKQPQPTPSQSKAFEKYEEHSNNHRP